MPGFDRTGPWGEGSRTGWGQGLCAPSPPEADPREFRRGRQRGFRRGFCFFGRGRGGWGYRWVGPPQRPGTATAQADPAEGSDFLARLDERLSRIEARLFGTGGDPGRDQERPESVTSE